MEKNNLTRDVLVMVVSAILVIPSILLSAWGLSLMYKWWIYPITSIDFTFKNFIGMSCFITYLKPNPKLDLDKNNPFILVLKSFMSFMLILALNYIAYLILR